MNVLKFNLSLIPRRVYNDYSKRLMSIVSLSNYRSLISVRGEDSAKFLQNLTTNNIYELNTEKRAQFSMILNNRGRMMFDVLIYAHPENLNHYLMELDNNCVDQALKYFKIFKIKKKVELNMEPSLGLYAVLDKEFKCDKSLLSVKDPRFDDLGYRVILKSNEKLDNTTDLKTYRKFLYQNGLTENTEDFKQASSIPLEYNIEFLNGVSFNKGCYLGQELVAKTHFTGVVRKRIMPFKLNIKVDESKFSRDNLILNKKSGQTVGKLNSLIDEYGVGMLRLANVDKDGIVLVDNDKNEYDISINIPKFWPINDPILNELKKF